MAIENKLLRDEVRRLRIEKYGPKSEQLSDAQLELLETEPGVVSAEVAREAEQAGKNSPELERQRRRQHPGRTELSAHLPRGTWLSPAADGCGWHGSMPAMKNRFSWLLLALLLGGCAAPQLRPYSEIVMSPGMRITATNPNGTVTIMAGEGTRRDYAGIGWQKSRSLIARSSRWNGSLGLYDPASSFSPYGRLLAEEGRIHCTSLSEAMRWLYVGSAVDRPVYTNNGLVFCYSVSAPSDGGEPVRSVELWQLYIDGRRPRHLPGASDRAIRVEGGSIADTSSPHPVNVGYELLQGDHEYAAH